MDAGFDGIDNLVRSRHHYKKYGALDYLEVAALLLVPAALPDSHEPLRLPEVKASAFDNVIRLINWKKPLRDKVLTDSIQVKS